MREEVWVDLRLYRRVQRELCTRLETSLDHIVARPLPRLTLALSCTLVHRPRTLLHPQ